jgi:hypothetical protein
MNPKPKKDTPSWVPEDDRPTLPDINVNDDEEADTLPRRNHDVRPEDEIASTQRPPSDS